MFSFCSTALPLLTSWTGDSGMKNIQTDIKTGINRNVPVIVRQCKYFPKIATNRFPRTTATFSRDPMAPLILGSAVSDV